MPEIQLGAHTIQSHGTRVARVHMHDWLILLLLVLMEVVLNVIHPFYRFVGEDMMTNLKYPLKDNTVPFWAVPLIAILLPFAIFLAYYFYRRDVYDLHHAVLGSYLCVILSYLQIEICFSIQLMRILIIGLLFSVLITGVITDAIKNAVGRPRPDFFWRCFPDGKGVFDPVTRGVICHGLKSVIKEGHKSFPSGHASWTFSGLGFLSLYLSGKIRAFDQKGHVAKLCIIFLPLLVAALVGISRVDDYWHHWQDVFAGGFIGIIIASFCYLQFFPPPYSEDGWGPHAYFQVLAESRNVVTSSLSNANRHNGHQPEIETVYISSEWRGDRNDTNIRDTRPILDDIETGRRI